MAVRTHTFNGKLYRIEEVDRIDGVTDTPDIPDMLEMTILGDNDLRSLHSALHEGLEASGMCDDCLHSYEERKDHLPKTWDTARLLWRLGWRRTKK